MNMDRLAIILSKLSANIAVINDQISGKNGVLEKQDELQKTMISFDERLNKHIKHITMMMVIINTDKRMFCFFNSIF